MAGRLELVGQIGGANHYLAVVSTVRPDGSVHSSLVNAGVLEDPAGSQVVGLVVRGDARKLAYMRRSGRASVTWSSGWQWVSVEGPVRIAGPADELPGLARDGLPGLLRAIFTAAGGVHDDWDEYDRVMKAEGRAAVLVTPERVLTNA